MFSSEIKPGMEKEIFIGCVCKKIIWRRQPVLQNIQTDCRRIAQWISVEISGEKMRLLSDKFGRFFSCFFQIFRVKLQEEHTYQISHTAGERL